MDKHKHYWQKTDESGEVCDNHIINRFDDDPDFMYGLTANEYLYFVGGAMLLAILVSTIFWYLVIYKVFLVASGFTAPGVIVVTIALVWVTAGYVTNKMVVANVANAKRGKPRQYLFHAAAWWMYKKLGIKPRFVFYNGSLDIRRRSK